MDFHQFAEGISAHAERIKPFGKVIKFEFPEGSVSIDGTGEKTVVHQRGGDADCTIISKLEHIDRLRKGELNPMMAMMTGKLKIKGDMNLALKLQDFM
jgi:putative sterol carrier protein